MREGPVPFASSGVALPRDVLGLSLFSVTRGGASLASLQSRADRLVLHVRRCGLAAIVCVLTLLCAGVTTLAAETTDGEALARAAQRGDSAQVRRLLAGGAPVNHRDARRRTPLLIATQGNHVEVARLLVAAGADVNAKDEIEDSPYLLAGARGLVEILRLTLAHGADLKSVNRFGGTALIPAAHYGHVEAVRVLLAAGVDPDHVNRLGWTALLEAIILGDGGPRHTEIVRLLLAGGASVNIADGHGVTPLAHARARGQSTIAAMLAAAGAR